MMKLLLYNNITNKVIGYTNGDQTIEGYLEAASEDEKSYTSGVYLESIPIDYYNYKIINGELVRLSKQEIEELRLYGRILTEEERQLQKLKPSPEEVKKAEQTIEILTLIQEVM